MGDHEAVAECLATEGSYVPRLKNSTTQNNIYSKLMLLKDKLPQKNCYTITVSPTHNTLRFMVSASTQLQKLMGYILEQEQIKKCYYTIENSKHGKLHVHGIILTKPSFRYKGLNDKYPGVQIYVEQYKPNPTTGVQRMPTVRLNSNQSAPKYREHWIKYICKQPLKLIEYESGKNFIKYIHTVTSRGSVR